MIIVRSTQPAGEFLVQLAAAVRGVARITVGGFEDQVDSALCNGWFVTDTIVAIPTHGFALGAGRYFVELEASDGGRIDWRARIDHEVSLDDLEANLALVKVQPPAERRALRLHLAKPNHRQIAVLTFAGHVHIPTPHIGFGDILQFEPSILSDVSVPRNSGGAPMFDLEWRVVGTHVRAGDTVKEALTCTTMLEDFRRSPLWPEVAAWHNLTDPSAVRAQLEEPRHDVSATTLRRAAVHASLPRAELSDLVAELLRKHVASASAERWVLRADVRQRVLREAGSLDVLRDARGTTASTEPLQLAIDHVLRGPPYAFDELDDKVLATSIQAVRWFRGVAPDLPSPVEISRLLERRRLRGRLEALAGPDFRGRARELAAMDAWFAANPGPLAISGIGGIGKSALLAKFALARPPGTLLLWLDFDRPDLAPDDARSIVALLVEQVGVQLEPISIDAGAPDAAVRLGDLLAGLLADRPPPLLVLDSFEVAQHAERYQELWPVLATLVATVTALRVIVTGRAPVEQLELTGKSATVLHLTGLADNDARAWLATQRVTDPVVVERVLAHANGIPLSLKLAAKLLESGGSLDGLTDALVDGVLYHRILDRVVDPDLKPVAMALIVLRRLTCEMVEPILTGLVDLPARPLAEWYADLGREMALVEGTDELRLRAEVRAAALWLVERDRGDLVVALDRAAERWYAARSTDEPAIAAELVYHRLRLADIVGAVSAWRDGCGAFLQTAGDALSGDAQRWLAGRLGTVRVRIVSLEVWEAEAAERIRGVIARGLADKALAILGERSERSPRSALAFHDAYFACLAGDVPRARAVLGVRIAAGAPELELRVLDAFVRVRERDRIGADEALAALDVDDVWLPRRLAAQERAAAQAARIALATELEHELALLSATEHWPAEVRDVLAPIDVVLPRLARALVGAGTSWEGVLRIPWMAERVEPTPRGLDRRVAMGWESMQRIPWMAERVESTPRGLSRRADDARRAALPNEPRGIRNARRHDVPERAIEWPSDPLVRAALEVAVTGWRRWHMVANTSLLFDVQRRPDAIFRADQLGAAILGPVLLVAESLSNQEGTLREQLLSHLDRLSNGVPREVWERVRGRFARGLVDEDLARFVRITRGVDGLLDPRIVLQLPDSIGLVSFLLAPDPLETLVHRFAGGS